MKKNMGGPSIKTGRQRKKNAARALGEFGLKQKRRVYFCSLSAELDVEEIEEDVSKQRAAQERERERVAASRWQQQQQYTDSAAAAAQNWQCK